MSRLSETLNNFEKNIEKESETLEKHLAEVSNRCSKSIENRLNESQSTIENAIREHQKRVGGLIFKSWGIALLSSVVVLSGMGATAWYLGGEIVQRLGRIEAIEAELKETETAISKFGIRIHKGASGASYIILDPSLWVDGKVYQIGDELGMKIVPRDQE